MINNILMKIIRFFRGLFTRPPVKPFGYGKHCALMFAINRYQQSPLRGCLNDQEDMTFRIKLLWPEFVFRQFKDSEVTRQRFKDEMLRAFANMPEGHLVVTYSGHGTQMRNPKEIDGFSEALYLYDGPLPDHEIYEVMKQKPPKLNVVFIFDCCFSTGMTNPRKSDFHALPYRVPRFLEYEPIPAGFKRSKSAFHEEIDIDWLAFAACQENETAMDAYIGGRYNGAYTYYMKNIMRRDVSFMTWHKETRNYLPSKMFPQTPTLTGKHEMMDKLPFF